MRPHDRRATRGTVLRLVLAALLAWASVGVGTAAWAQRGSTPGSGGSGSGGGGGSTHGGGSTGGPGSDHGKNGGSSGDTGSGAVAPTGPTVSRVLVVQVRFAADGVVVVDGGELTSASAWTPYLAPGMWVRAEGAWQGHAFQASALDITSPAAFCYYLGPARLLDGGAGWTEAWFAALPAGAPSASGTDLLARRSVDATGETLWLGRWVEGGWAGAPAGVAPPPPPRDGWWLLRGELDAAAPADAGAIRWGTPVPFGPR